MCVVCMGVVAGMTAVGGLAPAPVVDADPGLLTPDGVSVVSERVARSGWPSRKVEGSRCTKRGVERKSQGVTYVCSMRGSRLVWVRKDGRSAVPSEPSTPSVAAYAPPTTAGVPVEACQVADVSTERQRYGNQASAFPRLAKYIPKEGTVRMALIPIDWGDAPGSADQLVAMESQARTLADWYEQVSEGRLRIQWVIHPSWIRMPGSSSEYAVPYSGARSETVRFFGKVIPAVDPSFDFTGVQTANFLLPQGQGFVRESVQDWPWQEFAARSTAEGNLVSAAAAGAYFEVKPRERWSYWAHEFGHVLQLAHIGSSFRWSSMHGFDLLGSQDGPTRELSGWMRFLAGWLSDDQVYCQDRGGLQSTTIMLNPLPERSAGVKVAIVRTSPSEAVIVESRRPTAFHCPVGLGASAYSDSGVLVYAIDATKGAQEEFLRVVSADGSPDQNPGCGTQGVPGLLSTGQGVVVSGVSVNVVKGGPGERYDVVSIGPA